MDSSTDCDSEPILDPIARCKRFRKARTLSDESSNETRPSSKRNGLDKDTNPQYLQGSEAESRSSILTTPRSSGDECESSGQALRPNNAEGLSVPLESTLVHPRSQYAGSVPPLPICEERVAVHELLSVVDEDFETQEKKSVTGNESQSFAEIELTDFAVYLPKDSHHPLELRGLQELAGPKRKRSTMLFDGILCAGPSRRYVQAVAFEICSIGNYGKKYHTVGGEIWIQSVLNSKSDIYYRLKAPSSEYKRFYSDFLWLADLSKHFFDYCESCDEEKRPVSILNFRQDFSQWLRASHPDSMDFRAWCDKYGHEDFRQAICVNIHFLFKEIVGVKDELCNLQIWSEVKERDFIPSQKVEQVQTIVTPYVFECFKHLRFGQYLKSIAATRAAHNQQPQQRESLHLTAVSAPRLPVVEIPVLNHWATGSDAAQHAATMPRHPVVEIPRLRHLVDVSEVERQRKITAIKAGDVLSVIKDGESSVWRDVVSRWTAADNCWYIYVQAVDLSNSGKRSFVGIWLYKPCDTSCAKMKYPYPNELFFSEHCTCGHTIKEDEVIDIVTVEWSGEPPASEIFFIRQTYLTNDSFITLKEAHKQCKHQVAKQATPPKKRRWFPIGVTVLVCPSDLIPPHSKSKYGLEPCEIDDYENSGSKQYAVLRRLLRRQEIDKQKISRPNELVYSNETVRLESSKIERTCLVRFYSESTADNGRIPAPYNLDGAGNAFYITSKLKSGSRKLTPILPNDFPKSLIQGFNPEESLHRKLRSLDLYCGGGNFGRGLEEAGAIENEWAVDMDRNAIHTYYANLQSPGSVKLFYGSVNDQLFQALQGNPKNSALIPRPGEVEFISAGSPCQGFSKLNSKNRNKEMGLKNQSMVASVAAYVDFYRPRYGLLENVLDMATKGDEDVLSQLKCTIVGMGYQLSTFTLDAWSFGSPQSRSRIFVAFTAPDCKPIPHPELSHSHPSSVRSRGLGTLANGESFGERRHDPTPFRFLNARDAVRDLPDIGDGATYSCVRYPDHVLHIELKEEMRQQIAAIPRYPRGMNFWKAWDDGNGDMSKEERALFPDEINREGNPSQSVGKNSKAWGRVHPRHLFSTMVVKSGLRDARTGTIIHWDENRPTTVMEARRAQSFRDEDVILGNARERVKIIGNSVDRSVALALGLSVREVWEENSNDDLLRNKHRGFSESTGSKMSRPINPMSRTNSKALPNRALRNSYDSDDQDLLEQNRLLSPDPLALPISIARRPKTFQPIKRPSLDRKSSKEALKRPYVLLAPYNVRTEKSFKAAKLSAGSSPSGCDLEEESPSLATMTSKKNNLSRLREQPVNARHLSQTLQVVTQDFEREFMGRSSSVEGKTNDRVEIPMLPVLSRQGRRFTQKTRIKATSNRGNGSSSASLIPKPQVVIDLTADSEGSNGTDLAAFSHSDMGEDSDDLQVKDKMLPTLSNGLVSTKHDVANASTRGKGRAPVKCTPASQIVIDLMSGDESETESMPPATLPGRPAVVTSPSKYVPTRNPHSAYAKTYQARCMNQLRRHGPKR